MPIKISTTQLELRIYSSAAGVNSCVVNFTLSILCDLIPILEFKTSSNSSARPSLFQPRSIKSGRNVICRIGPPVQPLTGKYTPFFVRPRHSSSSDGVVPKRDSSTPSMLMGNIHVATPPGGNKRAFFCISSREREDSFVTMLRALPRIS